MKSLLKLKIHYIIQIFEKKRDQKSILTNLLKNFLIFLICFLQKF